MDQLLDLVADLQAHACELDDLEVKAARGGTPAHLHEDISGFANCDGGVLVFGVDECRGFEVVGVADAQRLHWSSGDGRRGGASIPMTSEESVFGADVRPGREDSWNESPSTLTLWTGSAG